MQKIDLSSFDNSRYKPGNKFKIFVWYLCNILFFKNALPFSQRFKRGLLILFGSKVGKNVVFKPNVSIKYPWLLQIGNHCWIGEHVWIDNLTNVSLGNNVCISQGAMLLCGNHDYKKTTFDLMVKPITLEEGVWIGAKAVVCPGVTCKSHAVLSVGSIAHTDLEAYGIYQGNPAKNIRERKVE